MRRFERISFILDSSNDYGNLRAHTKECKPPVIPFIGLLFYFLIFQKIASYKSIVFFPNRIVSQRPYISGR